MTDKKPILYMLISALSFAVMGFFVKNLSGVALPIKILFRNGVVFIIILGLQVYARRPVTELLGRPGNRLLLLFRGLAGTLGILGYFYSLQYLSLGDASMLNRLSPFFVLLFAFLLSKIRPRMVQILALVLAFTGAVLVLQSAQQTTGSIQLAAGIAGVLGAAAAGLAYTIIGKIGSKENPLAIMAYFAVFSFISTIPFLISLSGPTQSEFFQLLVLGLLAGVGQWFLTLAYQRGNPNRVSIFNYANIVFSMIIDGLILSSMPSIFSILGGIAIITGALISWKWG
ncbi:DMT family transporter [Spirochaeta lutea]|uniref:EamA domain-containing protein n=1 Tax=Spirochaeta lutea TaxID=1480694 RepID=A0A098R2R9_9SPIO|nr:DMT family transporter [Spirochaeta lutea]KGE73963.1 hypothetical protein DC28_01965 [Spirochaeta lutea]